MSRQRNSYLFEDPQFPPCSESVFPGGVVPPEHRNLVGQIYWKRASELNPNPYFVLDGYNRQDVDQGVLGDCWFLGSAAALASGNPSLFHRVVHKNQGFEPFRYTGQFHFSFCCYGAWTDIVVDDYLPLIGQDELVFAKNREHENEYWACLLEKAFAKLQGGYMKLCRGRAGHALVILTGGIPEDIDLRETAPKVPHDLYSLLIKSYRMQSLMVAAVHDSIQATRDSTGLQKNHVYSITGFVEVTTERGKQKLLRILNPWGKTEWRGAWADSSQEMAALPEEKRREMKFVKKDDGEFWMTFEDFHYYFDTLILCHLQPDALISELDDNEVMASWRVASPHGEWRAGISAGGATANKQYWSNPQVLVTLVHPDHANEAICTLVISLMQKDIGMYFDEKYAVGFDLYHVLNFQGKPLTGHQSNNWTRLWQCTLLSQGAQMTKRFQLRPGTYMIIPYLFNPGEEGQFLLRLVSEKTIQSRMLTGRTQESQIEDIPPIPSEYSVPSNVSVTSRSRQPSVSSQFSEVSSASQVRNSNVHPRSQFPVSSGDQNNRASSGTRDIPSISVSLYDNPSALSTRRNVPPPLSISSSPSFPVSQGSQPFIRDQNTPPFPVSQTDTKFATRQEVPSFNQDPSSQRRRHNVSPFRVNQNISLFPDDQDVPPFPVYRDVSQTLSVIDNQQAHSNSYRVQDYSGTTNTQSIVYSVPRSREVSAPTQVQGDNSRLTGHQNVSGLPEASISPEHFSIPNGSSHSSRSQSTMDTHGGKTGRPSSPPGERLTVTFNKYSQGVDSLGVRGLRAFLEDMSNEEWNEPLKFTLDMSRGLLYRADTNRSGRLDAQEVQTIWREIKAYRDVFHQFVPHPQRSVDMNQLTTLFEKLGFPVGMSIQRGIVARFGTAPNSTLALKDFIIVLFRLTSLFGSFDESRLKNKTGSDQATFTRDEFLKATLFI